MIRISVRAGSQKAYPKRMLTTHCGKEKSFCLIKKTSTPNIHMFLFFAFKSISSCFRLIFYA